MAEEMRDIIARIIEEVLKRINLKEQSGTLAVFSDYIFDAEMIAGYLKKDHENVTCALLDDAQFNCGFKTETIASRQEKESLAAKLKGYERIVFVTPPLWLLDAIARGDDSVYSAMLALRPLLWGREVIVLLDFEAPKNRRSPAFLKLADDINALEEMGITIALLCRECETCEELKDLVTEQDVKDALKSENKCIRIKPGAIVTHLARDTAKELGVTIGMQEEIYADRKS